MGTDKNIKLHIVTDIKMEEGSHDIVKETSQESNEEHLVHVENQDLDVDKTFRDAEEFLANFAGLQKENEQLKQANHQLERQLEKARQDLQEISIEKDSLQNQILKEREQNKDILWKLRSDFQKVQEERLQWKEKYLDSCMQPSSQQSGQSQSQSGSMHDYTNLSSSFGLTDQGAQPEEVILTLISEDSKSYKISIRECNFCGIGFCSTLGLNEHSRTCSKRPYKPAQEVENVFKNQELENTLDCEECNVKFPTHADLVQHNQFHQGTHKFLCRICNRSYQSNPGRLKHEQFEHGSLPLLQCEACGKQFKRKDRLKDHIATKHSVATPHRCPYCDGAFKLRDYLRKHVNQYHPGRTLSLTGMHMKTEFKPDYTIKSDGEVTVSAQNNEMPLDVRLSDVVENKFVNSTENHLGKTLTLTSFSIKSDHEETVSTEYNHITGPVNLTDVQVQGNELSDSEMTDADEVRIVIDTGEETL